MKKNIPFTIGVLTILSCLTGISLAGTHIWSGAGGNTLWSNAANWSSGGVPVAGEAAPVKLIFPAVTNRTSMLNIANLKIDSIEINTTWGGYNFPTAGISTTFTGAAGDNIYMGGSTGSVVWQPAIHLQSTCRFVVNNSLATLDFQGTISGPGGITKKDFGILRFSTGGAANTFTGMMRVENGFVELSKIAGTPCFGGNLEIVAGRVKVLRSHQIPDSASISITNGGLHVNADSGVASSTETVGPITILGTADLHVTSPNVLSLGGNITFSDNANADLTVTALSGAQINFAGATKAFAMPNAGSMMDISGLVTNGGSNAGLTKTGAGRLRLMSSNELAGPFSVTGGFLEVWTVGGLGTGTGSTTIGADGTLVLASVVLPAAESISLAGKITTRPGTTAEIQGNIALSGTPSLGASGSNTLKLSGIVSGNPTEVILPEGAVEYAGSSPNTYSGLTRILPADFSSLVLNKTTGPAVTGNIHINYKGVLKSMKSHQITDSASISFDTGGNFDLNHQTETVNSVSSTAASINPRIDLGNGSLTVIGSGNYQFGYSDGARYAIITGTSVASFNKQGSGTMILVGAQAGGSIIQDLTLYVQSGVLDIRLYWKSPIQVLGGLLKGTAEIASVVAAGGDIAFDKVTSTNFTYTGAGGKLIFALNGQVPGTGFARATISGGLNLTGIQLQGSLDFIPRNDSSFTLIDNNGPAPVTGTFAGLPEGSIVTIGGQPFRISYQGGPEGKDVVLTFVGNGLGIPEITAVVPKQFGNVQIEMKGIPGEKVTLFYNTDGLSGTWASLGIQVMNASGIATHTRYTNYAPKEFYRLSYTK